MVHHPPVKLALLECLVQDVGPLSQLHGTNVEQHLLSMKSAAIIMALPSVMASASLTKA